ncbi:hypothetical protein [Fictibacillus sp. 7GRE50]|uniref:Ger(x)C family spore germination protein n=1 Tax=Fictibacillus sp. 7GRE50 TaxID=2745878 RepID=UPI001E43B6AB|nr:hypothetical protein [Fictibacillus sp. 7GRE50]
MNRLFSIILSLSLILTLTGCWDQVEIDKKAFVVAIGLDKGKDNMLNVTYLISNQEYASQQGGNTNEPATEIIAFTANDVIASRNLANSVIAKEISYDLLSAVIVSKSFASDKRFLRYMYDTTKDREIKRSTSLIVTKEKAKTFIEHNKPKLETRPHKYFTLIMEHGIKAGLIPNLI